MKNILFKITIIVFASLFVLSCNDDFLNDPAPTDSVTSEVVFTSRKGAEAFISGILRRFRAQYTATDAAGVNSLYFARTVKGNDLINSTTWFSFDYANDNREPTYRRTKFTWQYCYDMINQANTLINGTEASTLSDLDKKEIIGQGKAIRAFFYFHLVEEFQHTYSYDPTLLAIPIYTELSLEGKPMSTVQQVYDLIVSDLKTAVADLPNTRLGKSYVNKATASGILARVYQVMRKWPEAEVAARTAYGGGSVNSVLDAPSYNKGFNDIENKEWIWGMPQTLDQTNYYYGQPHAHTDHNVLSYAATYINTDFVNLFSSTDVRRIFKFKSSTPTSWQRNITDKFKFTFDADHPIIRTAEMILVEAEAKYYNSDPVGAHNLLYALQLNRDVNAVKSSNTGAALLEEILLERRKELYGEIGVEWFDAKRYRRGITRTGNHRVFASLLPDDKKFFLKIPQDELDSNPNIDPNVNTNR
jgi:hypothetical protein